MRLADALSLAVILSSASGFARTPTTALKVDQAGYLPGETKLAMVIGPPGSTAGRFLIRRDGNDSVAFEGLLTAADLDADSGDQVRLADFSALHEKGRYYLDVPGIGTSWRFAIAADVFLRPYYLAMRSFYGQRCGTAVDLGPAFPGLKHDACHLTGAYNASAGKTGPHPSQHGWHDAGDYGRYVVNSGISTGTLLWTWELFHEKAAKVRLDLPESGGKTPDLLSEVRWNLEWMLGMQDSDGGVWHKQTSTHFCAFIMPEKDTLASEVIGTGFEPFKSSCATADFAAVMAIAGRVYQPYDHELALRCLQAAERAWKWVASKPRVTFKNPAGVTTGEYGDDDCSDELLWAAAELLRTAGGEEYARYFAAHQSSFHDRIRAVGPPSWSQVGALALWSYALSGKHDAVAGEIVERSQKAADEITKRTQASPYHVSLSTKDYIWGSNGVAANYALQLLIADRLQANPQYRQAALDNLHYILGRNAFSLSWVTQVGDNAVLHPHHRPSAADHVELPWPGLMSGGPNAGRQDSVMKAKIPASVPPAKAYLDDTGAYARNEVAINWNAPLVFALAAMLPD